MPLGGLTDHADAMKFGKNGLKMALFLGAMGIFAKKMREMAKNVTKIGKMAENGPFRTKMVEVF